MSAAKRRRWPTGNRINLETRRQAEGVGQNFKMKIGFRGARPEDITGIIQSLVYPTVEKG
jgi:hypothetical protein